MAARRVRRDRYVAAFGLLLAAVLIAPALPSEGTRLAAPPTATASLREPTVVATMGIRN